LQKCEDYKRIALASYHITATIVVSKRLIIEKSEIQSEIDIFAAYNPFAENSRENRDYS